MHDGIGLEVAEEVPYEVIIHQVADAEIQAASKALLEGEQSVVAIGDGDGADAADFLHPLAPQQQIRPRDFVTVRAEVDRQRKSKIAVDASDEDSHKPETLQDIRAANLTSFMADLKSRSVAYPPRSPHANGGKLSARLTIMLRICRGDSVGRPFQATENRFPLRAAASIYVTVTCDSRGHRA